MAPGPGTWPTWTRDGAQPGPGTGLSLDQGQGSAWPLPRARKEFLFWGGGWPTPSSEKQIPGIVFLRGGVIPESGFQGAPG